MEPPGTKNSDKVAGRTNSENIGAFRTGEINGRKLRATKKKSVLLAIGREIAADDLPTRIDPGHVR